jgi:chromosome segregation ATPase
VSIPEDIGAGPSQFVWAGGQLAPNPPGGSMAEVAALLREMVGMTREMTGMTRELLENSRQQLELSKRWEQRTVEQIQANRDEMTRLSKEHPELHGRSKDVEEQVAAVVGKSMNDLYDYVEHHGSDLADSDYVRAELVDKYGGMLYHLHGIHGIVKRFSSFEQQIAREQQQQQPKPPPTT